MNLHTDLIIDSNFTKIPNEVIDCEDLTDGEFRLWCRMFRQLKTHAAVSLGNLEQSNKILGLSESNSRQRRRNLAKKGYIEADKLGTLVTLPDADFEAEEELLIDEVVTQPNRKPSGITEKEAMALVSEAWNKEKPENFVACGKRLRPEAFWALETQAKRLQIERPNYGKLVTSVLRAACSDPWLSKQTWKIHNMFGWFDPKKRSIDDAKVTRVEELYKKGKNAKPSFVTKDDSSWLEWYLEVYPELGYTKVDRLNFATAEEAWDHDLKHQDGDTIFIYTTDSNNGRLDHWTRRTDLSHRKLNTLPL